MTGSEEKKAECTKMHVIKRNLKSENYKSV